MKLKVQLIILLIYGSIVLNFFLNDFNNKNNIKTVILHYNTHKLGNLLSNIFFEKNKYEKTQNNIILYYTIYLKKVMIYLNSYLI